uniref:Rho-GAP domain-containing protein n=1 Tax=Heterorhabditis bacteriophora TaxID=37862 RepID=A0A1I7WVF7_HETBA
MRLAYSFMNELTTMDVNSIFSKLFPHNERNHAPQSYEHLSLPLQYSQYIRRRADLFNNLSTMFHDNHLTQKHGSGDMFDLRMLQNEVSRFQLSNGEDCKNDIENSTKCGSKRKKKNSWKSLNARSYEEHHSTQKMVVSATQAPGGGTIVSLRDEKGQIHVRVEYDRLQILRSAQSPYSLLPPASLKNIVLYTPDILARFPRRHGIKPNTTGGGDPIAFN